jgi:uncharacterized protein
MEDGARRVSLDVIVPILFAIGQWRLIVLFLRWTRGRRNCRLMRVAFGVLEVLMVCGYLCGYSEVAARAPLFGAALFTAVGYTYMLLSGGLVGLHAALSPIRRHFNGGTNPARRRALAIAGKTLMAAPVAALGYGALIERTKFEVHELDLPLSGLPADLDGLQILQLSDIHLGLFLSEKEFARMIDAACELHPHVAFATGDFISTFGDPLEAAIRQLARVKADAGMLGCLGNHERYAHVEAEATRLAAQRGIRILRKQACSLRFGDAVLHVAGVDYQRISERKNYLRGAENLIMPGACNVLLSHNPDVFPVAARQGYNLVLAGHTHGGQVNIEILDRSINPARFFTQYVQGLYRIGPAAEYVTRGIGTIGIPARFGAPPEISLLRLRKA